MLYLALTPGELHAGLQRTEFSPKFCFSFVNIQSFRSAPFLMTRRSGRAGSLGGASEHFPALRGSFGLNTCDFNKLLCLAGPSPAAGKQRDVYGCSDCSPVSCHKGPSNVKVFLRAGGVEASLAKFPE